MVNWSVHTKRTLPFNCSNTVDTRNLADSMKSIAIAKRNLFFHYRDAKEILFYYFRDTKVCAKHEKTQVNSIFIVGIMFVR